MQAKDVMTREVVAVAPDTPTREIARILLEHGISAVPVVDSTGAPIGMVSEGDLIGRTESDRDKRREWWLALLAEGHELSPEFLSSLTPAHEIAKDVMAAPVIVVEETTEVAEIARLLTAYRVKRLPVVRDGRIVGIVSRADLVKALAAQAPAGPAPKRSGFLAEAVEDIERRFRRSGNEDAGATEKRAAASAGGKIDAAGFRALVEDFQHGQSHRRDEERRAAADRRKAQIQELIDHHIEDPAWSGLLHRAREAAEHGEKEFLLIRFPSQLCSDGGRAINAGEPDWPATLRGEAAEIYWRWEHDLQPHGFHLRAEVLDFPGGMPGDIGLFLRWGA
jgi:CBS domain-containing protein